MVPNIRTIAVKCMAYLLGGVAASSAKNGFAAESICCAVGSLAERY
jgi:hypothetical protein